MSFYCNVIKIFKNVFSKQKTTLKKFAWVMQIFFAESSQTNYNKTNQGTDIDNTKCNAFVTNTRQCLADHNL